MKNFALIGKHLRHSYSKEYFTKKFQQENCDAMYQLCELASIEQFPLLLHQQCWNGFNVTIPYKEAIIDYLTALDPLARSVGAVNTILVKGKELYGYNTDVIGFEKSLSPLLEKKAYKALILGTGGASKAVQVALANLNIPYTPVSRQSKNDGFTYQQLTPNIIASHLLIINATPLGMFPKEDECSQIPYEAITPQHICYDLIYNPAQTLFLTKCRAQGANIKNGIEMLHLQAEAAYNIWFNL